MPPATPILDVANPLFTPSKPARAFLATLPASKRGRPERLHRASFLARLFALAAAGPGSRTSSSNGSPVVYDARGRPVNLHARLSFESNSSAGSAESVYGSTGSTSDAESDASAYMHAPAPRAKRNASALDNNTFGPTPLSSVYPCARVPALQLGKRTYASFEASDDVDIAGERPGKLLKLDASGDSGTLAESSFDSEEHWSLLDMKGKSQQRVNREGTRFELRVIHEQLDLSQQSFADESADEESLGLSALRDVESSPATAAALLPLLARAFPGTGLTARIEATGASSLQDVADILGRDGKLTPAIISALGGPAASLTTLDLGPSLEPEQLANHSGSPLQGLNLGAVQGTLDALATPGRFARLHTLRLAHAPLANRDLLRLQGLPLRDLNLRNADLGDEAAFHLVALAPTLVRLDLSGNKLLGDDAGAALAHLVKLEWLSLKGTDVRMRGLRALMPLVKTCALEVSRACEVYLDKLGTRYLLAPAPPLITDPDAARALAAPALARNLAAHAAHNVAVRASGDLRIDRTRLRSLLATRKADLSVRAMVWRAQEEAEARAQAQGVSKKDDMSDAEDEDESVEDGEGEESMELDEAW
ncbi:unnamed protein product [Peniophora sp. CBMAI 1063]|nr:unnamed protein product [Peniophora sp. CBMAI 1063]